MMLAGRRATIGIAVAALGLGMGSSLAQAADETSSPTTVPEESTGTLAETPAAAATEQSPGPDPADESLVVELVIEAPSQEAPTPGESTPEDPTTEQMAGTTVTATAEQSAFLDAETEPTEGPDEGHQGGSEGHEGGSTGGHDGGQEDGTDGGHEDGTDGGHDGGPESGHDGGGSGGQGQGNPYRMTFSVEWRSDSGVPVPVLDSVLPQDWRALFELSAASRTGKNRPTSARCTYAESSDQLVCEFHNPGHRSEADGMIVPARPTATYSVTVKWGSPDWTIDGANAGPYSARELCPRGGDGHDSGGGHDSGHASLTDVVDDGHGGRTFVCNHRVVIQQLAVATPEPEPEPPTEPTAPPVPSNPSTGQAALSPSGATAATPQSLPATGSPVSVMLAIGAALSAIGAAMALVAGRSSADPTGCRVGDEGRMPA
jgi:hypothetical protein